MPEETAQTPETKAAAAKKSTKTASPKTASPKATSSNKQAGSPAATKGTPTGKDNRKAPAKKEGEAPAAKKSAAKKDEDLSKKPFPTRSVLPNEVFIGNVPKDTTQDQLRAFLEGKLGGLNLVKLDWKINTQKKPPKQFRGFAYATFDNEENARKAISDLNGQTLGAKRLRVQPPSGVVPARQKRIRKAQPQTNPKKKDRNLQNVAQQKKTAKKTSQTSATGAATAKKTIKTEPPVARKPPLQRRKLTPTQKALAKKKAAQGGDAPAQKQAASTKKTPKAAAPPAEGQAPATANKTTAAPKKDKKAAQNPPKEKKSAENAASPASDAVVIPAVPS